MLTPAIYQHHDHPRPACAGAALLRIPQLQLVCRYRRTAVAALVAAGVCPVRRARPSRRPSGPVASRPGGRLPGRPWRGSCPAAASPRCCRRGCSVTCSTRSASSGATTTKECCGTSSPRCTTPTDNATPTWLPPANKPVLVAKKLYVSPFNRVSGHYQVLAPRPDQQLDLVVSLHDGSQTGLRRETARYPPTGDAAAHHPDADPVAAGTADGGVADPSSKASRCGCAGSRWCHETPRHRDRQKPSPAIDPERWPAIARVPSGPLAAASAVIANRLLRRIAGRLPLRLAYPDGTVIGAGDAASPTLTINQPDRLARRIGRHGLIGFGESYMAGEWESDALTEALTMLATDMADLVPRDCSGSDRSSLRPSRVRRGRSRRQARQDVAAHYDLSERSVRGVPRRDHDVLERTVRGACRRRGRTLPTPSGKRSTGCWTRPASAPAPSCWKSAPDGESCASARPHAEPKSARSRSRSVSCGWPGSGSPPPGCPTGFRSTCATSATSAETTTR